MRISNKTIYFLIFIFTGVLIIFSMLDYYFFYSGETDLELYVDAFQNTLRGEFLYSNYFDVSYLGDHFSLILIPLIPFYYLWSDPRILLFLQVIISSLGALPLYWLAKQKLKNEFVALSFTFVFLIAPLRLNDLTIGFSPYHFAATFMLFAFYFLQKKNFVKSSIFLFLLLSCKEDTFIAGAFLGIYAFFVLRERKFGFLIMIISVLWGLSAIKIIQPYFKGSTFTYSYFESRYGYLGSDLSGALKTLFFRPLYVLKVLFARYPFVKLKSLGCLVIPVAFLPLLALPQFILLALPPLLEMSLSSNKIINGLLGHYSAFVYPFIFVAAIYGAVKIKFKKKTIIGGVILLAGIISSYYLGSDTHPLAKNFNFTKYQFNKNVQTMHKLIKSIPEDSSISASKPYALYLIGGHQAVIWRGTNFSPETDYLLIDHRDYYSPGLVRVLYEEKYGVKILGDGYLLLEKGHSGEKNEEVFKEMCKKRINLDIFSHRMESGTGRRAGNAWVAKRAKNKAGHLVYGPYLEYLKGEYQVNYRLQTNDNTSPEVIAEIDICKDHGRTMLARKEIKGVDFKRTGEYETFSLSFLHSGQGNLEFRVFFTGEADLWIERIDLSHSGLTLKEAYNSLFKNEQE